MDMVTTGDVPTPLDPLPLAEQRQEPAQAPPCGSCRAKREITEWNQICFFGTGEVSQSPLKYHPFCHHPTQSTAEEADKWHGCIAWVRQGSLLAFLPASGRPTLTFLLSFARLQALTPIGCSGCPGVWELQSSLELSWQERRAASRRIIAITLPGYELSGQVDQVFTAGGEPDRQSLSARVNICSLTAALQP